MALEFVEGSDFRPGRTLPPWKTRYPLYRRLGGPRAGLDRCEKSRPHRDSIPVPSSQYHSLYRLRYPARIKSFLGLHILINLHVYYYRPVLRMRPHFINDYMLHKGHKWGIRILYSYYEHFIWVWIIQYFLKNVLEWSKYIKRRQILGNWVCWYNDLPQSSSKF